MLMSSIRHLVRGNLLYIPLVHYIIKSIRLWIDSNLIEIEFYSNKIKDKKIKKEGKISYLDSFSYGSGALATMATDNSLI